MGRREGALGLRAAAPSRLFSWRALPIRLPATKSGLLVCFLVVPKTMAYFGHKPIDKLHRFVIAALQLINRLSNSEIALPFGESIIFKLAECGPVAKRRSPYGSSVKVRIFDISLPFHAIRPSTGSVLLSYMA